MTEVAAPPAEAPAAAPQPTAATAQVEFDQIQSDRMSGKISDYEWSNSSAKRVDELVSILAAAPPQPKVTPPAPTTNVQATESFNAHMDSQMAGELDAVFAPPANSWDYRFPEPPKWSDEQMASDSALRDDLHAAQMPKFVVESIASSLATSARTLANETPEAATARIEGNKARLTNMWGGVETFNQNLATVDAFLERETAQRPALQTFLERAMGVMTPMDFDLLLQVAKIRARRTT